MAFFLWCVAERYCWIGRTLSWLRHKRLPYLGSKLPLLRWCLRVLLSPASGKSTLNAAPTFRTLSACVCRKLSCATQTRSTICKVNLYLPPSCNKGDEMGSLICKQSHDQQRNPSVRSKLKKKWQGFASFALHAITVSGKRLELSIVPMYLLSSEQTAVTSVNFSLIAMSFGMVSAWNREQISSSDYHLNDNLTI